MNPELTAIKDKWAEKTAAKGRAFSAMQAAKLADQKAFRSAHPEISDEDFAAMPDSAAQINAWCTSTGTWAKEWDAWEVDGIQGNEKRLDEEQLAQCDAYVAAHPERFEQLEILTSEDGPEIRDPEDNHVWTPVEKAVNALTVFRNAGMEESAWELEVWIRHHFERQNIGGVVQARVRIVGGG